MTDDVPGSNPANGDTLKVGCWAENKDKQSLLFVEGFAEEIVTYSLFDLSVNPVVEFRDRMPEKGFRDLFVTGPAKGAGWVWHDKTAFDWSRIVKEGARPGMKFASAGDQLSAAARLAKALDLKGQALTAPDVERRAEQQDPANWHTLAARGLRAFEGFVEALKGMPK